ncbi:MAG: hypothetical protein ABI887_04635 [Burkholderiales bacterium]
MPRSLRAIVTVRNPRLFARGTSLPEQAVTQSKDLIEAELATIEGQDPLFFGDLPVSDDAVRGCFVAAVAALRESPEFRHATAQRRELLLLGSLTHALLDAALLREQLHRREQWAATAADRAIAKAAGV